MSRVAISGTSTSTPVTKVRCTFFIRLPRKKYAASSDCSVVDESRRSRARRDEESGLLNVGEQDTRRDRRNIETRRDLGVIELQPRRAESLPRRLRDLARRG